MTPEREFLLAYLSTYLKQHPEDAQKKALDICKDFLLLNEKFTQLEARNEEIKEQYKLLQARNEEMLIDYRILRRELENEQQKNLSVKKRHSSVSLPDFLASNPRKHFQS